MNEETYSSVEPSGDGDMDTTPPNPAVPAPPPQQKWEMPQPVFRKTSGRLPQSFVTPAAPAPAEVDGNPNQESEVTASSEEHSDVVEPQPEIDQVVDDDGAAPVKEPEVPRRSSGRVFLVGGLVLVLAGLVIIFIFVVYYLFLATAADPVF